MDLDTRVQEAGSEIVKAKEGKSSATLSMAYAGARFSKAVLSGLAGKPCTECAYVQVPEGYKPELKFFTTKVTFGPRGVERVLPIGRLSPYEANRLEEATSLLRTEIDDGVKYANLICS